jgi:ATP-dependent helicase/nuclease subunit B
MRMKLFLEEVAEFVLANYADATGEICLVTPNRRAGLFFRKHLSSRINKPMWAPEVLSIEDFINRISLLEVTDNISLLFSFYDVYRRIEGDAARPIDDFMRWGPVLLRDFDEIDATLEDPGQLFDYLRDVKRIETWNPDGSPPTEFQKNYLSFFSKLKQYHHALASHLLSQGKAYQGLSSRKAAGLIRRKDISLPWERMVFAGFNALNSAEEAIIDHLIREGKADFLPDFDPWYTDDEAHEAGFFIRKYLNKWKIKKAGRVSAFAGGKKSIRILGIAKNVNQARLAGNILSGTEGIALDVDTAIVLANEDLLIPVLNALPANARSINVTMGYPLHKTNMFGFFDTLFQLHLNAGRLRRSDDSNPPPFYHKDLSRFFGHSCTELLWDEMPGQGKPVDVVSTIAASNRSFFLFSDLQNLDGVPEKSGDVFRFLHSDWDRDQGVIFPQLLELTARLDKLFRIKAGSQGGDIVSTPFFLDFESLYYFSSLFRRMQAFLNASPFALNLQTLYSLFRQMASETRLSFSGEPLEGLQVMGVLETRNLDFKNIIMLSANESILPRPRSNNSFVPYDVRVKFGLQVHAEKDATYAYHFYRLIQRSENIHLIYNTQTEDIGSSEKSRYITQVQHELGRANTDIRITEEIVSLPPPAATLPGVIQISKSDEVMEQLLLAAKKGFSPSALGLYISCPLHFFLTRISRIEEPEDLEETIDASTMGTVIHAVLEEMYRPFCGKNLSPANISAMLKNADMATRQQFSTHYPNGDIDSGKNLLLFHLASQYVTNFLKAEKKFIEESAREGVNIRIVGLEEVLEASIRINFQGESLDVKVKGNADRIDIVDGQLRVIDYKTGKVDPKDLTFSEWEQVTRDSGLGKSFQLLTYAWLYHNMHPETRLIGPGIASMRSARQGILTLSCPDGSGALDATHLALFGEQLKGLIEEIMNRDVPFSQTRDEGNCTYCPFRGLCRRF